MRWLVLCLLLAACPSSSESRGSQQYRWSCEDDRECESGVCIATGGFEGEVFRSCTVACSTDEDCPPLAGEAAWRCGIAGDGRQTCVPDCGSGFPCVDDRPVACEALPSLEGHCLDCGCPSGQRCEPATGVCGPLSEVDGPCRSDEDCRTANCSAYAGVCRVPGGSPCTAANCDTCLITPGGSSFCSRACLDESECGGSPCAAPYSSAAFWFCFPGCDGVGGGGCPGQCQTDTYGVDYCDCADCTFESEPRELGWLCQGDESCASGACFADGYGEGSCTVACSRDSDCGQDMRCARVDCVAAGQTEECGAICLPTCDQPESSCSPHGHCHALPVLAGGTDLVCDVRLPDDSSICFGDQYCQSGRCIDSWCRSADGQANGDSCEGNDDCRSNRCVSGVCRGDGLIGDACSVAADCAAGTCCAGTCRTSC